MTYTIKLTPMHRHISGSKNTTLFSEAKALALFNQLADQHNLDNRTSDDEGYELMAGGIGYDFRLTLEKEA